MMKLNLLLIGVLISQALYAQNSPRKIFNFDHGWELYRIGKLNKTQSRQGAYSGTSWESQFNYEHITNRDESVDSIIRNEIGEAISGFKNEYSAIRSLNWQRVSLPCPARYEEQLNPGKNQFVGICYYRKQFRVPTSLKNKRLSLLFEGAMQVASVWVNGKFVMQHQGGYLPFVVPLNDYLKPDSANEIIIRLDNRDNPNTPPGKPLASLGFLYWSGIYRNAWLVATDPVYITNAVEANMIAGGGIFIRYDHISSCAATAIIKTQVKNSLSGVVNQLTIKQILTDSKGKIVAQNISRSFSLNPGDAKEISQQFVVLHPHLWSPDAPYLYHLTTEVWENSQLIDQISQHTGIRSLSYTRWQGFTLNGKPLRIVGTNRHQDHPFIGNALSDEEQYRDLKRIKEAGFNFVRLAHYPQDPAVFNICDSLGLMVADPIPGWQFFNNNAIFKERVFSDIRQTIRRDRNHPCVIMWEMSLNESYPPDSFRIQSSYIAHQEYPGNQFFTSGDTYGSKKTAWDVPYNGWEEPFGRPQNVQPAQCGFVREYGHFEFGGYHSTTNANRSQGENALLQNAWNMQWEHNLLRSDFYYPWTIGDAQWEFYDGFEAYRSSTTDWGVMDVFRLPKFSYYFYKSQLDPYAKIHAADNKPMVYIANWWVPEDTSSKVIVYSNCDQIALYVNGRLVGKQKPDNGPDSPYGNWDKGGNPFDGGNCKHLNHPPFTFKNIRFEKGEIKAIGFIRGYAVDTAIRRTPLKPRRLDIQISFAGKPLVANGSDVVFVYVSLIDKNGTVEVQDNDSIVQLNISGPAQIISPAITKVRAGIASFMIRADESPGKITLMARTNRADQLFRAVHMFSSVSVGDLPSL
jgi:beta-galactosidase